MADFDATLSAALAAERAAGGAGGMILRLERHGLQARIGGMMRR